MAKYRKKPVVVEAFQLYVDSMPDWFMDKVTSNDIVLRNCDYNCEIKTLEGTMIANGGNYVIKGVKGEIYSVRSDIFLMTYEKAEE